MSTNKTQNYALHSWLPTDDFQLSEINQNFAALDAATAAKTAVVAGSYTGTGYNTPPLHIETGARPKAVLVMTVQGAIGEATYSYTAMGIDGGDRAIKMNETGFSVDNVGAAHINYKETYYYIALL